jgi:glycosyltransferase involved in cell wall biosynthesis
MNIFIIPSWYPSSSCPLSGVFTNEQVRAIAELSNDVRVIVSLWGHDDSYLDTRRPWVWPRRILWGLKQQRNRITLRNGVHEVFNPQITWSVRLPFGGARQIIDVNRRNFVLAQEKFGPIDLIHAHVSYPAGYVAALLAKEFGLPYVITEHMSPFPFPPLMKNGQPIREIRHAFEHAAASIAVSPSLAKRVASFGYPMPRVVPNMVDERSFALGEPKSEKIVFFTLCGITEQKGVDHLLEAIALWNPPSDSYEFRIGGVGPKRKHYQAMANALGLGDHVKWLGAVSRDDAPELFRQCHIYVMPSRHETFGVVYAEAIACGKPIIATRCGGPEFIVNDGNGLLVDVGDVSALSQAMQKLATNWAHYNSGSIRRNFEKRFSRHAVVSQLREVYDEVVRN